MNEIVGNSITGRAVRKIAAWWHSGVFYRGWHWLRRQNESSNTLRRWRGMADWPLRVENSVYARVMAALRRLCQVLGDWLRQSVFYRVLTAIRRGWDSLAHRSRIVGWISRISLHQWLLVAFGLYLPLEFVIRDQLHLAALSSVWEELFILVAVAMILWRRALRQTTAIRRETPLDCWLLLFAAVGYLLMVLVRPYPDVAAAGYRIVMEYLIWFFLIVRLVENDGDFRVLWITLLLLLAVLALHGLYQYAVAVEIPATWTSQTEMDVRTRVFSLTGSPNILGSLMVLLAPLAAGGVYYARKPLAKLAFFALLACSLLTLLFTFSRGAWLGMIVAIVIFALFIDKRLIALMVGGMAAVLLLVPSITNRITYLFTSDFATASAVGGRAMRWALGKTLLESNPWLGFGLGRYGGAVAMQNQILDKTETFAYYYLDNYYLKTTVEMGYIGMIFYALLLIALIVCALRCIQRSGGSLSALPGDPLTRGVGQPRILAVSLFAGMMGVLMHCLFKNIFEEPYMTAYFWGMAAMLMYLGFFRGRSSGGETS